MKSVKDVIEALEEPEVKYIMVDGKPVTIKAVIDRILNEDDKIEKRQLSEG